ncbi:cytochrome c oxidase subunit 3 [Mesorhizobium sp. BR1-1-16]|uniref:cytochrome c oxidase subunit 3 n=1 Tax=Mesorhizobium sp. BR1-1-16 TaxID=2876653 RepID=UPI001CC94950|nr:cytochrome c oxidase subunit 3 [Mesorhizobium sp. BR1-1-16]MBZ9936988.1 cytochrome c oxidase subunit 3 [Mesorhizobium sp. BR1-1-16]
MTRHSVADVSGLPTSGFGATSPMWWGTMAFMAIEGMGFALGVASYLYLAFLAPEWPMAPPPDLIPGSLVTALLVVSVLPNHLLDRWTKAKDLKRVRFGLLLMSILGALPLVVRWFELGALNVNWDTNAYGSIVWLLLGLHTTHLLTDLVDTLVLAALMFTRHGRSGKRFSDVSDNAFYWDFVVGTWVVLYLVIYWFPRI